MVLRWLPLQTVSSFHAMEGDGSESKGAASLCTTGRKVSSQDLLLMFISLARIPSRRQPVCSDWNRPVQREVHEALESLSPSNQETTARNNFQDISKKFLALMVQKQWFVNSLSSQSNQGTGLGNLALYSSTVPAATDTRP